MPGVRKRGEEIRSFILSNITGKRNIAALTAGHFGISLPAVYKHINRLVSEKQVVKKSRGFILQSEEHKNNYKIEEGLNGDTVWENDIKKYFAHFPKNVLNIWGYGFLEIFNNAIEHSKGKIIHIKITVNKVFTTMVIFDDGIGIFKKIQTKFKLADEKGALLELAKGKQTTDIERHPGQGIFFTSKVFDDFNINSNGITFDLSPKKNDKPKIGKQKTYTNVLMRLANNSDKKLKDIFDKFSTEIPGDFDKTIVPVYMANSNDLVSRSQARRILSGLELFREVILDFRDIENIGQAFADEIFRVFKNMYPNIVITAQNANTDVQYMINRAKNTVNASERKTR
jgi:anti-sigma regulatory factor (Ser/Thr protein kinase)